MMFLASTADFILFVKYRGVEWMTSHDTHQSECSAARGDVSKGTASREETDPGLAEGAPE